MNIKQDVDCFPFSHFHSPSLSHSFALASSSCLFLSLLLSLWLSLTVCVWQRRLWLLYCCLSGVRVLRFCRRRSLAGQRVWHTHTHTHPHTHTHWPHNSYRGELVLPAMNLYKLNSWSFWDVRSQRHWDSFDTCGHTGTRTHTRTHLWLWVCVCACWLFVICPLVKFKRCKWLRKLPGRAGLGQPTNRRYQAATNKLDTNKNAIDTVCQSGGYGTRSSSSSNDYDRRLSACARPTTTVFVVCPSK